MLIGSAKRYDAEYGYLLSSVAMNGWRLMRHLEV